MFNDRTELELPVKTLLKRRILSKIEQYGEKRIIFDQFCIARLVIIFYKILHKFYFYMKDFQLPPLCCCNKDTVEKCCESILYKM